MLPDNQIKRTATAWMIRRDGEAIPCIQHIYAGDVVEETLYSAQWLYLHTLSAQTKAVCLSLIKSYAVSLGGSDFIAAVLADIAQKPYVFLTVDFINSVKAKIENAGTGSIFCLCDNVKTLLNNEFLRARYGGLYNTKKGCRDMYFRISSTGFDWKGVICGFVNTHKCDIDTVTVVYDEESTGIKSGFYRYNEMMCNKLCADIFTDEQT